MRVCVRELKEEEKSFSSLRGGKEKITSSWECERKIALAVWVKVSCAFNWWINSSLMYFPYFSSSSRHFRSNDFLYPFPYFCHFIFFFLEDMIVGKYSNFCSRANSFSPFHVMIIHIHRRSPILLFIYKLCTTTLFIASYCWYQFLPFVLYPRFTWEYSTFL